MARVPTWLGAVWAVVLGCGVAASAQTPRAADLVKPQLLADASAVQAGKPFRVGVLLRIEPKWHVYWKNPGDSGQAATVTLEVPAGFKVSDVQYPVPTKFLQPGDLVAYGYGEEVMLLATVTPPAELPAGGEVPIGAKVKYLVCDQICLPGKAELSMSVPVSAEAKPANEDVFGEWVRQVPVSGEAAAGVADVKAGGKLAGKSGKYAVDVAWKVPADNVEFFPGATAALNVHDITVKNKGKQTRVTFVADLLEGQRPDVAALDSVVVYTDDRGVRRGIEVSVPMNAEQTK